MAYEIIIKPSAQRDLNALSTNQVQKLFSRIAQLSENPRPFGVQKLHGEEGYRMEAVTIGFCTKLMITYLA